MAKLLVKVNAARKAVAAFTVGVATFAGKVAASPDAGVTSSEWGMLGAAVVSAVAVWTTENKPG